ncbi:MAG: 2-oxoacid:ferredoxin oxidoreductase subunit beta [Candidatus Micrarchaeota archaeon]
MVCLKDLEEPRHAITWCPGCGNFSILAALKKAIVELNLEPHETVVASGIGCSSKLPHFINTYGFESIHGRGVVAASGIKLANHKLNVIAVGGDGDGYGIGTNHFVHACRRNYDMNYITHNNQIYGLTTGQTSPTSDQGFKSKSTPEGVLEVPVNPIALGIIMGATYVARGFSGDLVHLTRLIKEGIAHKGFALIDVMQPCITWNKINTFEYFKNKCYKLKEEGHDVTDKVAALAKAQEWGERIPVGLFYKVNMPTYEDGLPQLKNEPLVKKKIDNIDVSEVLEKYE